MPSPPTHHVRNVAHNGQPANTTGHVMSAPSESSMKPLRVATAVDAPG